MYTSWHFWNPVLRSKTYGIRRFSGNIHFPTPENMKLHTISNWNAHISPYRFPVAFFAARAKTTHLRNPRFTSSQDAPFDATLAPSPWLAHSLRVDACHLWPSLRNRTARNARTAKRLPPATSAPNTPRGNAQNIGPNATQRPPAAGPPEVAKQTAHHTRASPSAG